MSSRMCIWWGAICLLVSICWCGPLTEDASVEDELANFGNEPEVPQSEEDPQLVSQLNALKEANRLGLQVPGIGPAAPGTREQLDIEVKAKPTDQTGGFNGKGVADLDQVEADVGYDKTVMSMIWNMVRNVEGAIQERRRKELRAEEALHHVQHAAQEAVNAMGAVEKTLQEGQNPQNIGEVKAEHAKEMSKPQTQDHEEGHGPGPDIQYAEPKLHSERLAEESRVLAAEELNPRMHPNPRPLVPHPNLQTEAQGKGPHPEPSTSDVVRHPHAKQAWRQTMSQMAESHDHRPIVRPVSMQEQDTGQSQDNQPHTHM